MPKIKEISFEKKNITLKTPYTISTRSIDSVTLFFVKVELDIKIFGHGSASPATHVTGESIESVEECLSPLKLKFLEGKEIGELFNVINSIYEAFPSNPSVRTALEMAILDAFTSIIKTPLSDFLGRKHQAVATSITIGIKSTRDTAEEAEKYIKRGFNCLKIKTGHNIEKDVKRIKTLREEFGKRTIIRVDANQAYNLEDFRNFRKETQELNIEFVEQPFKVDNFEEYKQLTDEERSIVAVDESILSPEDAKKFYDEGKLAQIYNIKMMRIGGFYNARTIAEHAGINGIDLMWGCYDESCISISAALHYALTFSATKYLDLDGCFDLSEDFAKGGFRLKEGMMSVSNLPGLGVVI